MFAHRLALAIGEWDVDGMLAAMSSTQFGRWIAFESLHPFGDIAQDRRDARQSMLTAAAAGIRSRTEDFMLHAPPQATPDEEQTSCAIESFARMLGQRGK